ncbi:hypothetical protein MOUN0_H03686 [Monosporozyma unispora]|nr:Phosphotransferase enzyme [Kazachstania unispora]
MMKQSVKFSSVLSKNGSRNLLSSNRTALATTLLRRAQIATPTANITFKRLISNEPEHNFTKLSDANDKVRDTIFQYTWGTWLKNDKLEKAKRTTRFSIEGLTSVMNNMYKFSKTAIPDVEAGKLMNPTKVNDEFIVLPNNVTISNLDVLNPNEPNVYIKTVSSIHEGKHHRVYKLTTNVEGKQLILRLPYLIDSNENITKRMQSEVATQDFLANKLKIDVPKIYAYGLDNNNPLGIPFMIQEFIEGDLLMKKWDPLLDDETDGKPKQKLMDVIDCVSEIHSKLASYEFNSIGSLYFKEDITDPSKIIETIDDRWCVGPIIERNFYKNKKVIASAEHLGPWKKDDLSAVVKNLAEVELASVNERLALIEAGSSSEIDKKSVLLEQKQTFENMIKISPFLFTADTSTEVSKKIPNFVDLIKPRLYLPDLDPMNIIMNPLTNKPYLIDFENTCIKPFILQNSPKFIEYEGPKIYNIKTEIPDYEKLPANEKAQCQFIYKRTRNQYLWEDSLNKRQPKLITSMAPPMKLLRSPYVAMLERKSDEGFLIIDENLLQLKTVWKDLYDNKIVAEKEFPIEYSENQIETHVKETNALHQKLISTPFAATQGWVPQDMFDTLLRDGVVVKGKDGNYTIKTPEQNK